MLAGDTYFYFEKYCLTILIYFHHNHRLDIAVLEVLPKPTSSLADTKKNADRCEFSNFEISTWKKSFYQCEPKIQRNPLPRYLNNNYFIAQFPYFLKKMEIVFRVIVRVIILNTIL